MINFKLILFVNISNKNIKNIEPKIKIKTNLNLLKLNFKKYHDFEIVNQFMTSNKHFKKLNIYDFKVVIIKNKKSFTFLRLQ